MLIFFEIFPIVSKYSRIIPEYLKKTDEIYTSNYLINYIWSLFANILDFLFQKNMLICFYPKSSYEFMILMKLIM